MSYQSDKMDLVELSDWMILPIFGVALLIGAGVATEVIDLMQMTLWSDGSGLQFTLTQLVGVATVVMAVATNRLEVNDLDALETGMLFVVVIGVLSLSFQSGRDLLTGDAVIGSIYVVVMLIAYGYIAYAPIWDN